MTASTAPLSAAGRELPKRWLAIIATIWGGQAVSMITSYAAGYAVVWYITETTGSALMLAAAALPSAPICRRGCSRPSAGSSPTSTTAKPS